VAAYGINDSLKVFLIKSIVAAYGINDSLPHIQENVTPHKSATVSKIQDSPSTAMSKLSTDTSPVVSLLVYLFNIFLHLYDSSFLYCIFLDTINKHR
jgi:hypothetical protein